jgi:hypothetical protein
MGKGIDAVNRTVKLELSPIFEQYNISANQLPVIRDFISEIVNGVYASDGETKLQISEMDLPDVRLPSILKTVFDYLNIQLDPSDILEVETVPVDDTQYDEDYESNDEGKTHQDYLDDRYWRANFGDNDDDDYFEEDSYYGALEPRTEW